MISPSIHIKLPKTEYSSDRISKGIWIALLHVNRIPPHVGLIINGSYFSLTIKGRENGINLTALEKMIAHKKIECAFVQVSSHPVFSHDFLKDSFELQLNKFDKVEENKATCLSPVKQFFNEFYFTKLKESDLLHDTMIELGAQDYIESFCTSEYLKTDELSIPHYTLEELNERIELERKPYQKN